MIRPNFIKGIDQNGICFGHIDLFTAIGLLISEEDFIIKDYVSLIDNNDSNSLLRSSIYYQKYSRRIDRINEIYKLTNMYPFDEITFTNHPNSKSKFTLKFKDNTIEYIHLNKVIEEQKVKNLLSFYFLPQQLYNTSNLLGYLTIYLSNFHGISDEEYRNMEPRIINKIVDSNIELIRTNNTEKLVDLDYSIERLIPQPIKNIWSNEQFEILSFYHNKKQYYAEFTLLIFINEQLELMHTIYQDWLQKFNFENYREILKKFSKPIIEDNICLVSQEIEDVKINLLFLKLSANNKLQDSGVEVEFDQISKAIELIATGETNCIITINPEYLNINNPSLGLRAISDCINWIRTTDENIDLIVLKHAGIPNRNLDSLFYKFKKSIELTPDARNTSKRKLLRKTTPLYPDQNPF